MQILENEVLENEFLENKILANVSFVPSRDSDVSINAQEISWTFIFNSLDASTLDLVNL